MKKQKLSRMKIIQYILGMMMLASFAVFLIGEAFLPQENGLEESSFRAFDAEWVEVKPDGSEIAFTVPGTCDVAYGEWAKIQTTLPQNQEEIWVCMHSMQQDMKIYVGEELRKEYSTLDIQPVGKTSTMTYLFFRIDKEDAGKDLSVQFMSDSFYSGYVSDIYAGGLYDIVFHFCKLYLPSLIVAAMLLIIGLVVVTISLVVQMIYKKEVDLVYLGSAVVIAATWIIVESKIRQFILPNSTMAMLMGFLMIAILPYPFLAYMNSIQKHRYQTAYMVVGVCTATNFSSVVLMQLLGIKDFFESMTSSHIVIVMLIVTMTVTIIRDMIKGYVRDYREVAVGFAVLMAAGIVEIGLVYMVSAQINGISLCVGLVILLMSAGLKTIRDTLNIEKEKQSAIAASKSKAQFLANMSHEIRTPMNTVIGMNEMILRENTDAQIEEYAQNIQNASRMMMGLINDILDFSKIEAGKMELVENQYSLAGMLNDVVFGSQVKVKQKNLDFIVEIDRTMPSVLKGDEIRIKQILNNLLSNAIKYTEQGKIVLKADGVHDENGFTLVLSVKDSGMGIKKEDLQRLFDSFQRLELEKNRYIEGTGLGLNITKQLTDLMNGTITVESEYGKGSCFIVRIPQEIIDTVTIEEQENTPKKSGDKKAAANEKELHIPDAKILVVDDTNMNLALMKALLKRTGAQLDTAAGGEECFAKTKENKYDLILMDHMMPQPDGVATLHMIREDADNKNLDTPIVVLTANAIAGMKEQYLEEGFADYLSKPVEVKKLDEILEKFLCQTLIK